MTRSAPVAPEGRVQCEYGHWAWPGRCEQGHVLAAPVVVQDWRLLLAGIRVELLARSRHPEIINRVVNDCEAALTDALQRGEVHPVSQPPAPVAPEGHRCGHVYDNGEVCDHGREGEPTRYVSAPVAQDSPIAPVGLSPELRCPRCGGGYFRCEDPWHGQAQDSRPVVETCPDCGRSDEHAAPCTAAHRVRLASHLPRVAQDSPDPQWPDGPDGPGEGEYGEYGATNPGWTRVAQDSPDRPIASATVENVLEAIDHAAALASAAGVYLTEQRMEEAASLLRGGAQDSPDPLREALEAIANEYRNGHECGWCGWDDDHAEWCPTFVARAAIGGVPCPHARVVVGARHSQGEPR